MFGIAWSVIGGNVWGFLKKIPGQVWLIAGVVVLAIFEIYDVDARARREERLKAKAATANQAAHQAAEVAERVDAFHEASRAVEQLPDDELLKRTETDPNNRGRVPRD